MALFLLGSALHGDSLARLAVFLKFALALHRRRVERDYVLGDVGHAEPVLLRAVGAMGEKLKQKCRVVLLLLDALTCGFYGSVVSVSCRACER